LLLLNLVCEIRNDERLIMRRQGLRNGHDLWAAIEIGMVACEFINQGVSVAPALRVVATNAVSY